MHITVTKREEKYVFVPNDDAILDIMFLVKPLTGILNSIACIKNLPKKNHVFNSTYYSWINFEFTIDKVGPKLQLWSRWQGAEVELTWKLSCARLEHELETETNTHKLNSVSNNCTWESSKRFLEGKLVTRVCN